MRKILAAIVGTFFCCTQVFAFDVSPTQINTGKKKAQKVTVSPDFLNKLFTSKSIIDNVEMVSVTDDGERLSSIRGQLSSPLSGDPIKAATAYIREHSGLFNLPKNRQNDCLYPIKNISNGKVNHLYFQMIMDGVPVRNATIDIHINPDGVVTLANGSFPTIEEITNTIELSKYQAIGIAKKVAKINKLRAIPDAKLNIVSTENGNAKMAYVAQLPAQDPIGDWEVLVDAQNGSILYLNNEMNFKTGLGAVYVTNPLKCQITQEPLHHLTTNTLTGKWVTIKNEKSPTSVSEEDKHIYTPESTHFDEVGMYNYITTIHDFFASLGHKGMDKSILSVVHHGTNYDNAFFSAWENKMCFGDGNKFNPLAREASVAYHEYSHAMLNSITYLAYSGESGAINEGQADYFACSVTNDPALGEWVCAKMGRPYLRHLVNDLHYPEDIQGEVHADGKIWGAVLWDIRNAIGKADSDVLIYKSLFYLNGSRPKFIDAYNALVTADNNEFNGKHLEQLQSVFVKRGIVAKNYNGAVLTANEIKTIKKFRESHLE